MKFQKVMQAELFQESFANDFHPRWIQQYSTELVQNHRAHLSMKMLFGWIESEMEKFLELREIVEVLCCWLWKPATLLFLPIQA